MSDAINFRHHEQARLFSSQSVFSPAAQLGCAKIALALLLRVIFFKNHSLRVYIAALASFAFLAASNLSAEDLEQIGAAFDVARDEANLASPTAVAATHSSQQTNQTWPPIASHIKLSEGIPFPPDEAIVWDPDPPGLKELREITPTSMPLIPAKRYRRPSRCEQPYTKRTLRDPNSVEVKDKPLYDALYLPDDMIPSDAEEVYGESTRLYPYGPSSGEGVYTRMEYDRVTCVPYRLRMTNTATYEDFGHNALKNYRKDQSGQGAFDPWVTAKLFGQKR